MIDIDFICFFCEEYKTGQKKTANATKDIIQKIVFDLSIVSIPNNIGIVENNSILILNLVLFFKKTKL